MACFADKCFVVLHCDLVVSDGFNSCTTIDNVYYSLNHALQDCKDLNLVIKEMTDDGVDFEPISDGNIETHYYIIKTNLF